MILTDKFVFIHQPKTGGTFVTEVLTRLLARPPGRGVFGRFRKPTTTAPEFVNTNQHGTCSDIPSSHCGKLIVSTIRNPYDRYVSQYEFEWWKTHPEAFCDPALITARYPHFPELSFAEFVELSDSLFMEIQNDKFPPAERLGRNTMQFVAYFFRNPRDVFPRIDADYLAAKRYRDDLYPVQFLLTERLNRDLHDFLLRIGYPRKQIDFILTERKIYPQTQPKRRGRPWQDYYTPELKHVVRCRERLLFDLFPEFDV